MIGATRVQYHGPSGEWDTTWPPDTIVPSRGYFRGLWYRYAGTQDGIVHFREELDTGGEG